MRNYQSNEDINNIEDTEGSIESGTIMGRRRRRFRRRGRRRISRRRAIAIARARARARRRRLGARRRRPVRRVSTRRADPRRLQRLVKSQARSIANRIVRERDLKGLRAKFGRIYTSFDPADIIENQQETVTKGLWTGGIGNLLDMHKSSDQTATQTRYYYEIFQSASNAQGAEPQLVLHGDM